MSARRFAESIAQLSAPEDLTDFISPTTQELVLLVLDKVAHFESQETIKAKVNAVLPSLRKKSKEISMEVGSISGTYPVEITHVPIKDIKLVLSILRGIKLIPQGFSQSTLEECKILVYSGTKEK